MRTTNVRRVLLTGAALAFLLTLLVILLAGLAATSAHAQDTPLDASGSVASAPATSSATNDTQTSSASSTSDPASTSSTKPAYTRHPAPTGVVISRSSSSTTDAGPKPGYTPAKIVGTLVVRQAAPSSSSTSFTKPPYTRGTIVSVYVSRSATATATAPNQTTTAGGTTSTSYTQHAAPRAVVFRQAPASSQLAYTGPSPVLQLAISGALALLVGVLLGWLSTRHTPRRH